MYILSHESSISQQPGVLFAAFWVLFPELAPKPTHARQNAMHDLVSCSPNKVLSRVNPVISNAML